MMVVKNVFFLSRSPNIVELIKNNSRLFNGLTSYWEKEITRNVDKNII